MSAKAGRSAVGKGVAGAFARLLVPAPGSERTRLLAVSFVLFGLKYLLNLATPFIADDYTFAHIFRTSTRVANVADIAQSQWIFYMTRNGRILGGFFEQAAVLMGKPMFNVLNSLMFVALVWVIYLNANGRNRPRVSLLVGVSLLLWFALPSFGQSALFTAGATNYLWLAVIALGVLIPYRMHVDEPGAIPDSAGMAAAMVLAGFAAGWTNENLGPTIALLMVAYIVYMNRRGIRVPTWAKAAPVGAVGGAGFLIAAPGNYRTLREEDLVAADGGMLVLAERFAAITHAVFLSNLFLVLAVFLVCATLSRGFPADTAPPHGLAVGVLYLGAAFVAAYAMVLSPHFPPRAWTGVIALATCAAGVAYVSIDLAHPVMLRLMTVVMGCALLFFSVRYAYVYGVDIRTTGSQWQHRVQTIEASRQTGQLDVVVPPIQVLTTYNGAYDIKDLDEDPTEWPNVDVARYFGIRSIRVAPASTQ